jgi:hypothetical protein
MKLEELLRHMADNVEEGRRASEGVLHRGEPTNIMNSIEWGYCGEDYTLAPKTRLVNGYEVPLPETEPLAMGQAYVYIDMSNIRYIGRAAWGSFDLDVLRLRRGIIFLTEAAARANAVAMLGEGVV